MFDVKISGLDNLQQKMQQVSKDLPEKVFSSAARSALAIARKKAIENAKKIDDPATAEAIWKNISVIRAKKKERAFGPGTIVASLGVRGGAAQYANTKENVRKRRVGQVYLTGGETWYWRLLEFGTEKMAARPFLLPAVHSSLQEIFNAFQVDAEAKFDRLISEKAKK